MSIKSLLVSLTIYSLASCDLKPSVDILSSRISPPIPESTAQPCDLCRLLVASFEKGIERTARGKFEGGDARWEESRLGSYQHSEIRLVEIQEKLCEDASKFKDQCHHLAEETESIVEDWWFDRKEDRADLLTHLCINERQVCCNYDHFGPSCTPCPGTSNGSCNRRGLCNGNGTRSGTGECNCNLGYSGKLCNECASGFYEKQGQDLSCQPCDVSCDGDCSSSGPKGCKTCKDGYKFTEETGCVDVNECQDASTTCSTGSYCLNTAGSYRCHDCDKSCASCYGSGATMCNECSPGYQMRSGICTEFDGREGGLLKYTRFITYIGLIISTYIISRSHFYMASILGSVITVYIAIAEYTFVDSSSISAAFDAFKKLIRT